MRRTATDVGADHLDLEVTGAERHRRCRDPVAGPRDRDVDGERLQRYRPHQLHGQAGHGEARTGGLFGGAGDERGHGTAVLVAGIPRTAGVLGGDEVGPRGEQRLVGHRRTFPEISGRSPLSRCPQAPDGQADGCSTTLTERMTSPWAIRWATSEPAVT